MSEDKLIDKIRADWGIIKDTPNSTLLEYIGLHNYCLGLLAALIADKNTETRNVLYAELDYIREAKINLETKLLDKLQ